jgi:hypothetical protein
MTVREHLKKAHQAIADYHRAMTKCHSAAMAKDNMGADEKAFHRAAAAAHDEAASVHTEMSDECTKAMAASEMEKSHRLMPTEVSALAPPPGVRSIPRYGQREYYKPTVDPMLEHIVRTEDE